MAYWQSRFGGAGNAPKVTDKPLQSDETSEHPAPLRAQYEQDSVAKAIGRGQLLPPEASPVSFRAHGFPLPLDWETIRAAPIDTTPQKTAVGYGAASINHLAAILGDRATSRIDRNGDFHDVGLVDLAKFFHARQMWKELDRANDMATRLVGAFDRHQRMNYESQLENLPLLKSAFEEAQRVQADLSGHAVILVDREIAHASTRG